MTDPTQTSNEPLRFERTYTTGPEYPTRFARAFFRYTLAQPRRWVVIVLVVVLFTGVFFLSGLNSGPLIFPIAYVAFIALIYGVGYFSTVRQLRRRVPSGSVFGVGFRSETFVVRSPQVTSEVAYSLYRSCQRRGNFVILRQRISRVVSFLPIEIFTDESLEFLQSTIAAQNPRP